MTSDIPQKVICMTICNEVSMYGQGAIWWKQSSQLCNCVIITLPLATNGTDLFAVSDRTYKKRAFQSQEVAITTSNTFLRRHLFSSTTCIRSGFYAATRKKRGLQIDLLWFTLILLSRLCFHFAGWINPQTSRRFEIPQWGFIGSHWSSWIQRIPRIPLPLSMVHSTKYHKHILSFMDTSFHKKSCEKATGTLKKLHACGNL